MKDKSQIFLSYAYEDREKVIEISKELTKAGFDSWMDVQNLMPGQAWDIEIRKALEESKFIILFLSRNSLRKEGYLQKEIKSALRLAENKPEGTIFIIPIRLESIEIPNYLKHIQVLDIEKPRGKNWEKLLSVLREGEEFGGKEFENLRKSVVDVKQPKKHIFVAMPFADDLEDCYFYGIKVPIQDAGFNCIRVDKKSFTGDILVQIKHDIETASAVVAILDGTNPNVSLEVGYAWGKKVPTILIIKDTNQLPFDLKGQKCLVYRKIQELEKSLTLELKELMNTGIIK